MNMKDLLGSAYKEGMTLEEVEAALKDVSFPEDNSAEVERLKNALSKSNSEAADYKKQLREKMTEDEAAKQKEQEERKELQSKYEELLYENEVSKFKANLLGMGYDEKLANETAEAMANGETEKVFANQKKHLEAVEKKVRGEVLKDTPKPIGDGDSKTMTLESFRKMSPQERYEYSVKNPEEYKTLYAQNTGGNE